MNILTCVYCGNEYPKGTPPSGSQILTDHIKVCEAHPLFKANSHIAKLRAALLGLIGCEASELQEMEAILRVTPGIEKDKIAAINAIHALQETQSYNE